MLNNVFASVEQVIEDAKNGKIFIITDNEDRENEGDLVFAADFADAKKVNFLITYGRGLVCVPICEQIAEKFDLPKMTRNGVNDSIFSTNFTVSVGAKKLTTSGISAEDRAYTIKVLADENSTAEDLSVPGHIFPLVAKGGGVLQREGHTEASVEICRLANLTQAAVICEILDQDGAPARLPYISTFAKTHNLNIISVEQIKNYVSLKLAKK